MFPAKGFVACQSAAPSARTHFTQSRIGEMMGHAERPIHPRQITREIQTARQVARQYLKRYPKDRYDTMVESWYRVLHVATERAEGIMTSKSKPPGRASFAAQRELVELAKRLDLAGIVKKTGRRGSDLFRIPRWDHLSGYVPKGARPSHGKP